MLGCHNLVLHTAHGGYRVEHMSKLTNHALQENIAHNEILKLRQKFKMVRNDFNDKLQVPTSWETNDLSNKNITKRVWISCCVFLKIFKISMAEYIATLLA